MPQADGGRLGPGSQLEVILQVLVGALIYPGIHAGPQVGVAQLPKAAHVAGPVLRVGSEEVVAVLGGGYFGAEPRSRVGSFKMQGQGVAAHRAGERRWGASLPALMAQLGRPAIGKQRKSQPVGFGKKPAPG